MMEQDKVGKPIVSFRSAWLFWLKLGCFSFGGPAGQIAMMHTELVERRHWISEKRFLHALNYCMVLPGPEAQQLATYIGWLMHRTWGGIVAGGLFILPSLFILIGLSWVYMAFGHAPWIAGLFYGIKPAVAAIVIQAVHRIGSRTLKQPALWVIAAVAFIAIFLLHIPFPVIVFSAAIIGYFGGRWLPHQFRVQATAHHKTNGSFVGALIDDDTPIPAHAKFSSKRFMKVVVIGLFLWSIPMISARLFLGSENAFTHMDWFFSKAALLTFGGAYAVLPYVYQGVVEYYAWLTPTQMIDGLALGEGTPGPLIMVVTFVGFVTGYGQMLLGSHALFFAGALAATWVTWFTFLPSFVFIFAGAPLIEATHDDLKFTAPLTAITAAVVGVILNLALFFVYHVWWPAGFLAAVDWLSAWITLGAIIGLFYFKRSVLQVIGVCALVGLLVKVLS